MIFESMFNIVRCTHSGKTFMMAIVVCWSVLAISGCTFGPNVTEIKEENQSTESQLVHVSNEKQIRFFNPATTQNDYKVRNDYKEDTKQIRVDLRPETADVDTDLFLPNDLLKIDRLAALQQSTEIAPRQPTVDRQRIGGPPGPQRHRRGVVLQSKNSSLQSSGHVILKYKNPPQQNFGQVVRQSQNLPQQDSGDATMSVMTESRRSQEIPFESIQTNKGPFVTTSLVHSTDKGTEHFVVHQTHRQQLELLPSVGEHAKSQKTSASGMIPIHNLTADIRAPEGDFPENQQFSTTPAAESLRPNRGWLHPDYQWAAPSVCHGPLYFEEVNLERYGYSRRRPLQPFISGAHFYGNVLMLPYRLVAEPAHECVYTLGHYRPGSRAPFRRHWPPAKWSADVAQGATVAGLIFLIP